MAENSEGRGNAPPSRNLRPCPICGKPASAETRPFCSRRCADIDLHRWLSGAYAIPTEEPEGEASTALPPDAD